MVAAGAADGCVAVAGALAGSAAAGLAVEIGGTLASAPEGIRSAAAATTAFALSAAAFALSAAAFALSAAAFALSAGVGGGGAAGAVVTTSAGSPAHATISESRATANGCEFSNIDVRTIAPLMP